MSWSPELLARLHAHEQGVLRAVGIGGQEVQPESVQPPAATGITAGVPIMVHVKKDGGAEGTSTTPCTWTYSIYAFGTPLADIISGAATPIAVGLSPGGDLGIGCRHARQEVGRYEYAQAGTLGFAVYDAAADQWRLLLAIDEQGGTNYCDVSG